MALSSISYVGNGSTNLFSVTFPYLDKTHVKVLVGGVATTAFTFTTLSSISITAVPANLAIVLIQRVTPTAALVDFVNGSTLTESLLDTATLQTLYIAEETKDLLTNTLGLDLADNKFDALSKVIKNLATPVNLNDAVNKSYVDSTTVASAAAASTSATNAANSATSASTSATNAANSATSSSTSATNSANSAAAALAAVGGVKVTTADTLATPLASSLVAGTGCTLTVINPGANETLQVDVPVVITSKIQSIASSVAANALTLNYNGGVLDFRNPTLTNGTPISLIIAANSIIVPSGATLGTVNGVLARLVLLEAYNGGSPVACVVNLGGSAQLDETNLISPTTISAAATSTSVIYSASTVGVNSPYKIVGFIDITETTAGTWAVDASLKQGVGGQALTALSSIGFGQTYQTPVRTAGVTYYNTTGKPFILYFGVTGVGSAGITINGNAFTVGVNSTTSWLTLIVLVGANYVTSGSYSLTEVR